MELERIKFYSRHIEILDGIIHSAAAVGADFELLQSLPDVEKIVASIIMYETGEISRFKLPNNIVHMPSWFLGFFRQVAISDGAKVPSKEIRI
jgi:hypothetical protein